MNFRYINNHHIGVSIDETTSLEDINIILKIFAKLQLPPRFNWFSLSHKISRNIVFKKLSKFRIPGKIARIIHVAKVAIVSRIIHILHNCLEHFFTPHTYTALVTHFHHSLVKKFTSAINTFYHKFTNFNLIIF